jgi:transposase
MSFATLQSPFSPGKKSFEAFALPDVLPDDIESLKTLLGVQQNAHTVLIEAIRQEAHNYVIRMLEQAILARQRMFGSSSEQMAAQSRLFDEAEVLAQASTEAQDTAPQAPETPVAGAEVQSNKPAIKLGRGKRVALATGLPRVDVLHDVPEADRTCACGTPMVEIGQDISEQLDIVPMQVRVLRHIRMRYGCPTSQHAPVTAALPAQPLPKSNASVDFLAMLLAVKFVDGLPLARFENVLTRHGAVVPRQTLARWVIGCAGVLQPLHNLVRDILLDGSLIYMDETVVQVLKEKDKSPTSNSYMWVQTGGPPDKPVVLYDYDPSRSASVPTALLEGFAGYLMTDGYDGYNEVGRSDGIERLACWAHVRRRFVEATRVQPKGKRGRADEAVSLIGKLYRIERLACWAHVRRRFVEATRVQPKGKRGRADEAVSLIGKLYRIERVYKAATPEARYLARQSDSVPVLAELHAWMLKNAPVVIPKSALGTALAYMGNLWSKLVRYTERGDLPIDNNRCENAIRPFVVGRKAWLFSDTPAGAYASAVIYSLVQTAKANGLEPYTWLRRVLRDLPAANSVEAVEALLPWNLRIADLVGKTAM